MADQPTGFAPNSRFGQVIKDMGMDRPEVPSEAYDEFRESYFNKRIAPKLRPDQREKQRETFLQRTKRPELPTSDYISKIANIGMAEAEKSAASLFTWYPGGKGQAEREALTKQVEKQRQSLAWHGRKFGPTASFVGGATGYLAGGTAAERAVGAVAGLAKGIPYVGAGLEFAQALFKPGIIGAAKRSLAFGALQAAEAEPGKAPSEFVKGTGWGVGGELGGAALGRLWRYFKKAPPATMKEVDDFVKTIARGEGPTTQAEKDIDAALTEDITEKGKSPGYLDKLSTVLDEKASRPVAVFVDEQGRSFESPLPNNPERAYAVLKEAIGGGEKATRFLSQIRHDEMDQAFVNDLIAKLKENYDPWGVTPTQIATGAGKGIDAGGGTARVDGRVLKQNYAKQAPTREEARRFIKQAVGYPEDLSSSSAKHHWDSRVQGLLGDFETAWNPFGNWMARSEAALRLEEKGLTDLIPSPEVRARWRPSEGMNLPRIFNEKGWYETLDSWKGRTAEGTETTLDLRTKEHLTNSMKILWDPSVPHNSPMFRSALQSLARYELQDFLPGRLSREEIASLINVSRAGTETEAKAIARVTEARTAAPAAVHEHLYQQVGRLAEIFSKQKDIDQERYIQQYGRQTVEAAMNMASLMWERSKGDILQVKWGEDVLKQGIQEGILPPVDPTGKPTTKWFEEGEEHIAQRVGVGADDITSLLRASKDSKVLRLAEQYNVDPRNIDRELLEEVGEAEVERAKEVADAAKKRGVSVYDASLMEEARRLGIVSGEEDVFEKLPPSERPSKTPGEPSGLPMRTVRTAAGAVGRFAYNVRRASSGLPSRIYVMFDDAAAKMTDFTGRHTTQGTKLLAELGRDPLYSPVARDIQALASLHGIDLDQVPITFVHRPNAGFEKKFSAPTLWHEDLHGILSQIGMTVQGIFGGKNLRGSEGTVRDTLKAIYDLLPAREQETWNALMRATGERGWLYHPTTLPEESFVHAATYIRHGDTAAIAHMAAVDTDVEHVYSAVQAIAGRLRNVAGEMAPGNSKNFIMDRLGLLESFSNIDRYKAVRQAAEQMFASVGADVEKLQSAADVKVYERFNKMWSAAEESIAGRLYSPNYTAWAEAAGARHALYPTQMPPGRTPPPMPETGIEDGWHFVGPSVLWEKLAPTFSWINWVDNKLNAKYGVKGAYLPLADRAKAVDEAYRAGGAWLEENRKSALAFLEGGKKKLETYGYFLTKPLRQWGALAQKMEITNDDLARLKMAHQWLSRLQEDTGVPVHNYLQELQPRLASHNYDVDRVFPAPAKGSSMSTFHRLIASGQLNPRDLHLGRLVNVFLREGMEKRFTGEPLKELQRIVDKQIDGKYALGVLRAPLQRYIEYMRGIPDNSGKMINRFIGDLQGGINDVIRSVNRHLPAGYKAQEIKWAEGGGDLLRRAILLSYISGIGLRPAIAIRDGIQGVSLSLPIIGPRVFLKGIGLAITRQHWGLAEESGALLKGKNVGEVFGDIFEEMTPGKGTIDKAIDTASMTLAPSRWGHNFARRTVFAGVYDEALPAVKALRKLEGDAALKGAKDFLNKTGLWFADTARQRQMLSLARDKYVDPKEVAKQVALEALDLTLWPYRRGTQPGFLKYGVGRIFGQYGLWPMSFLDYMRRLVSKVPENPKMALPALATFIGVNYSLVTQARKHMGVDVAHWFGLSPAGFAGSPHMEFVMNMFKAMKEDQEGRQARKKVLEYPLQFVPSYNEFRSVEDVWDKPWIDEEGHITQAGFKAMGFKIYKGGEPTLDMVIDGKMSFDKYLEYEAGQKKSEYEKAGQAMKKMYKKATE